MALEYHEPPHEVSAEAREWHRAIASLIEELEAIDWYYQRADVTQDEDLRKIMLHNMDEEAEHAAMALEFIRRKYPKLSEELEEYLFTSGSIVEREESDEEESSADTSSDLGIGNTT